MSEWFTFVLCLFALVLVNNVFIVESAFDFKIDKIADKALPSVKEIISNIGFDPMTAPNISDDLSLATINLTDGVITGASKFKRNQHIVVSLVPSLIPTVRINASLYFPELHAKFNYTLEAFIYSDTGALDAVIDNITGHVTLDVRVLGGELANPTFKIDHFGDVVVDMTSDSYISWLQNIVADNAIPFYKDHIAEISEKAVNELAGISVKEFNDNRFKYFFDLVVKTILDTIGKILGFKKSKKS